MPVADDLRRLLAELNTGRVSGGGYERPPWSDPLRAAEQAAIRFGERIGLDAQHDPAGNLWLVDAAAPATGLIGTGSHLDTVPGGGAYDGALGVASALLAVAELRRRRIPGAQRLAVLVFADEEGWRFGTPTFGSGMLTGRYDAGVLDRRDTAGVRLGDVAPSDPPAAHGGHQRLAAFVEVHIEQGVFLAPAGAVVGVASGLAARVRYAWTTRGEANHAGTTPMNRRRDALVAAARLVLAAETAACGTPGAVATVGQLVVRPGGANVIPAVCAGSLDIRAPRTEDRDGVVDAIRSVCPDATLELASSSPVTNFDPQLRQRLVEAARQMHVPAVSCWSYAGHDAGILAASMPAAMLFVRSRDGVSHHPSEHADDDDCMAALSVLGETLERLAGDAPFKG